MNLALKKPDYLCERNEIGRTSNKPVGFKVCLFMHSCLLKPRKWSFSGYVALWPGLNWQKHRNTKWQQNCTAVVHLLPAHPLLHFSSTARIVLSHENRISAWAKEKMLLKYCCHVGYSYRFIIIIIIIIIILFTYFC